MLWRPRFRPPMTGAVSFHWGEGEQVEGLRLRRAVGFKEFTESFNCSLNVGWSRKLADSLPFCSQCKAGQEFDFCLKPKPSVRIIRTRPDAAD